MKKLSLFLFVFFLVLSFNALSQDKELVYIQIQEKLAGGGIDSYMKITYPDQSVKTVALTKLRYDGEGADENGKIIQKEIQELLKQGYELTSTTTGSGDIVITTKIFMTRKK